MAPKNVYEENLAMLHSIVKSKAIRRQPLLLSDEAELENAATELAADRAVPIIRVSSVTGEGLPLLRGLFSDCPHGCSRAVFSNHPVRLWSFTLTASSMCTALAS